MMTLGTQVGPFHLVIEGEPDVDREELGKLTTALQARLLKLRDVEAVERVRQPAPPDTKAMESFVTGELWVWALAVHQAFRTIRTYLEGRPVRVRVREEGFEAEISGPPEHVRKLADELIRQRGRRETGSDGT